MIRFTDVSKVYSKSARPALDQVSAQIDDGELVFLMGASGSGKSTLMRLMLRMELATTGRIQVGGYDLANMPARKVPYLRRTVGMVFQDFQLIPKKTVYENVAFALEVTGKSRRFIKANVPEVLEIVGLAGKEKRKPHELSGGEQQRVAIARAIINRPAILLADEPTGNLDADTSLGVMNLLDMINGTGATVVIATHDAKLVNQMQRRVIQLSAGRVIDDYLSGGSAPSRPALSLVPAPPAISGIDSNVSAPAYGIPSNRRRNRLDIAA